MRALDLADDWPAANVAIAVVTPDGIRATRGDRGRPHPWASVTKLVTALATLVAVEEGTVALDAAAADDAADPALEGVTAEHLLAHASGLAPDERRRLAEPGTRRIYSNAGFELLADVVSKRTGIPFSDYAAEAALQPLGMAGARLGPDDSPAAGLVGTLDDLARLAAELLRPTVIAADTLQRATATAFPGLNGVLPGFGRQHPCDWGLGFELRGHKSPHWTGQANSPETFGHFGRSGTFLWVDHAAPAALAVLTDEPFGPWAAQAWPALSDAVLSEL